MLFRESFLLGSASVQFRLAKGVRSVAAFDDRVASARGKYVCWMSRINPGPSVVSLPIQILLVLPVQAVHGRLLFGEIW